MIRLTLKSGAQYQYNNPPDRVKSGRRNHIGHNLQITLAEALREDYPEVHFLSAVLHARGLGVSEDLDKAREHCLVAASAGLPAAQYLLAGLILGDKFMAGQSLLPQEIANVVKWLSMAAQAGHEGAAADLGVLYAEGKLGEVDAAQSIKWLTLAANGHSADAATAAYLLASQLETCTGAARDDSAVLNWLRRAASLGSAGALSRLGDIYKDGEFGVSPNLAEASKCYSESLALQEAQIDRQKAEIRDSAKNGDALSKKALKSLNQFP